MRRPAVSLNRRNTHPNRSRRGHWRSERDWPGTTEDLRTWILSSVSKRNTPIRQPGTKNRSPSLPNCHRSPYPQERCGSLPGTSEPVVVPGLTASMPKSNAGSRTSFVSASIAPRPRVSIWPKHWQTSVLATRRRPHRRCAGTKRTTSGLALADPTPQTAQRTLRTGTLAGRPGPR